MRPFASWLCGVTAVYVGCDTDPGQATIDVRIQDGPTVPSSADAPPEAVPDAQHLRFVFASVLGVERSAGRDRILSEYLASKLGERVEIVRRRTYTELNDLLRTGAVQAGVVCTGAYAVGREEFGLRLLVVPTVNHLPVYRSLVVARTGLGRRRFEDFEGRDFAFSDPLSNSGYRYAAARLFALGTDPDHFFRHTLFTHSHDSTVQAVANGLVDGGVVDSLVWDRMIREDPSLTRTVEVIETSPDFPMNPVVISPRAPPELAASLEPVLLGMGMDAEGRKVLDALGLTGFVEVPDSTYDPIVQSWRDLGVLPPIPAPRR